MKPLTPWAVATMLAAAGFASSAIAREAMREPEPITVKVIGFNDFHGYITPPSGTVRAPSLTTPNATVNLSAGGAAYFGTLVQQLKSQNANNALIAAGDLIGASPLISALFHEESTIESLNLLGVDAAAVGNHEFDKGSGELKRLANGGCYPGGVAGVDTCVIGGQFTGANFPYLSANVIVDDTGRPLFAPIKIKEFTRDGRRARIAFIGLTLKGTPGIVTPAGVEGLSFLDEAATVNAWVPRLRKLGIEAIVVVIHQGGTTTGLYDDQSCPGLTGEILPIVNALDPAVDAVISGHTHQAYICKAKAADGVKDVLLTSAGQYGRFVTDIDFTLDARSKDIIGFAAHNLPVVNDVTPPPAGYVALAKEPAQQALVDTYSALATPLANTVIGSIAADITRTQNGAGESALGDVIADAQLAATAPAALGASKAAFMNPGGIRTDFLSATISGGEQPGQVTYGEAFNVQPFYNTLTVMTLTGAQIKTLLEQQFDNPAVGQQRFLQVSQGFSYSWDNSKPTGSKVVAGSIRIDGVALDPAASYRITCNSFLSTGGDGFLVFKDGTDKLGGALDIDALTDYFGVLSPVAPGPQNRITRLN